MEKTILPLNIKQVDEEEKNFTFEGHLAAFDNIDHDGDIIIKGAFSKWLTKSRDENRKSIPVFWSHSMHEPVGIFPIENMSEDNAGLFVKGIMPRDDTFVAGRVIPQMKVGSIAKMSIGYRVMDFDYDNEKNIRTLKEIALWEGSLVALPANENATITSFKTATTFGDLPLAGRQHTWDAEGAVGRVRQWAGIDGDGDLSDPDMQAKYKQAFFWYDSADSDLFGAYKLPFADIIDGRLTAVPRGVFAAAGAMRGARGGVYLPSDERPAVTRHIERYYEKMGLESPFGKSFRIDDFSVLEERIIEKILRDGARFSRKNATVLITAIKSAGLRDVNPPGQRDVEDSITAKIDTILQQLKGG